MLIATCHCGAVRLQIPRKPRTLTDCNCSICRRYGTLWAYYKASAVRVVSRRGATTSYRWGDKTIDFVRCNTCGCVTHWRGIRKRPNSFVGVNASNLDAEAIRSVRVRKFDGAKTWKYLD